MPNPEIYFDEWLDEIDARGPRRFTRTVLLGMGVVVARSFLRRLAPGRCVDSSHPDSIAEIVFRDATVIVCSKSGGTVETQTMLAHALASGLDSQDLLVVTDPGTTLRELGDSLGALVVYGDPLTGGRFSALSTFGLIPALYAGWRPEELRHDLAGCFLTDDLVAPADEDASQWARGMYEGVGIFSLGADPTSSGGSLWFEQLIAETTGKSGRGFIPLVQGPVDLYHPSDIQCHYLLPALLAWHVGVDPFNQPNIESVKKEVFAQSNRLC